MTRSTRGPVTTGLRPAAPLVVDQATSLRLSRIRQKDTTPERTVRSLLFRLGVRFRVRNSDLPGSPDIANRSGRWVVFVHGCFWHAHEGCRKATIPKRNSDFWRAKFAANVRRDVAAITELRQRRFRVLVVWECSLIEPQRVSRRLARFLKVAAVRQIL